MKVSEVTDGIYRLSANAYDLLFESMWPIPNGVSMSSYIVKGEGKIAIVDGLCGWDGVPEQLFEQFKLMDLDPKDIDYVVINHMEPDHSGWLSDFKNKITDDFTLVTHKKSIPLLEGFFGITEDDMDIITVGDGSTLDLGGGRVLAFAEIPNVHWPETIATFDTLSGTLMPCDAFGSFGAVDPDAAYDDLLSPEKIDFYEREAVRYYANIVGAFSQPTAKAIAKAGALPIKIIAPGHGIVWRKNPMKIVNDYLRYTTYSHGPAKEKITIIWGSMYGNTEACVQPVAQALRAEGLEVAIHQVPDTDNYSFIISDVWESSGVVLACPTYEYNVFPALGMALEEIGNKKAFNRKAFYFGSYGWASCAFKEIQEINVRKKLKWDFIEPYIFKGAATDEDKQNIINGAKELAKQVKDWCATK